MKYELANIVFKKKPTDNTMRRKYPFTRHKEMVRLIEDTPINLYKAYKDGRTFKPHPFKKDNLSNARVRSIVLDFDHLTKEQCDFLENICFAHRFHQTPMYGDYSAGTKVRLYENRDIPDYVNPKWGYKVFYPVDCLCTWEELNNAFLGAVSFFNPQFNMDEVRSVWEKWLKANNNKVKVQNPIFANWILPDVAMLNSFRTQVTYGVRPEQKEDFVVLKDDERMQGKQPCGGIKDYSGLEWKHEDAIEDKEPSEEMLKAWNKVLMPHLDIAIEEAKQNPESNLRPTIPTSKSMLARRLKRSKFDDLTWDDKANAIFNARMYSNEIVIGKARQIGMDAARTLTRNLIEMEIQRNINIALSIQDILKNHAGILMTDIIAAIRQRCGLNILTRVGMRKGGRVKNEFTDDDKNAIVKTIVTTSNNYTQFKAKMKIRHIEQETKPAHLKLLEEYTKTKDNALLDAYMKERKEWIADVYKKAAETKTPYIYRKKGLKKWLIGVACLDLPMEELMEYGFEPTKLIDEQEWVNWCKETLNQREGDLNDVSDDELARWYRDYRSEYNKKFGILEGKVRKQRASKYDELFKGKSKEEISDMISKMDISPNMKSRLRKEHGIQMRKRK